MAAVELFRHDQSDYPDAPSTRADNADLILFNQPIGDLILTRQRSLSHGISAVTNEVFAATAGRVDFDTDAVPVIVKLAQGRGEPREIAMQFAEGILGGWLQLRLKNEALILDLLRNNGVKVPEIVTYDQLNSGSEVLVLEQVGGETCLNLRDQHMPGNDREALEAEKGRVLGRIHATDVSEFLFGPLEDQSKKFGSWQEYFSYKVSTTLSVLYGRYHEVAKLAHTSELASSEEEWKHVIEKIAEVYGSPVIQQLIAHDGIPTVVHGDFWDANLMGQRLEDGWEVRPIDFERGDIGGRSFDAALFMEWKIGGRHGDPVDNALSFIQGYESTGATLSPDIQKYIVIYGLWQYLDFMTLDPIYHIDRTDESIFEIKKLITKIESIAYADIQINTESVASDYLEFLKDWQAEYPQRNFPLTERKSVDDVFGKSDGIIINGLRLPPAPGFDGYLGEEQTELLLRQNIRALRNAGVNGVVLETTFDRPHRIFYNDRLLLDYYAYVSKIAKAEAGDDMKVGINFILFDLPGALAVARSADLDFVITDEFVNPVVCPAGESYRDNDFEFTPDPEMIAQFRTDIGADGILLIAGTHLNYYESTSSQTINDSIAGAVAYNADAVVIGKNNASRFDASIYQAGVPVFVAGGIQTDDFQWVQEAGYSGALAGSLFEKQLMEVDAIKAIHIMQLWD